MSIYKVLETHVNVKLATLYRMTNKIAGMRIRIFFFGSGSGTAEKKSDPDPTLDPTS